MLPEGDRTPPDFAVPKASVVEWLKRSARRVLYPAYGWVVDAWIRYKGYGCLGFDADYWLWGQRGNDYEALRRRVNRILPICGARVLIAGCGTGRDMMSWLEYEPKSVFGVDYFNYERAWAAMRHSALRRYPRSKLAFRQTDLVRMQEIPDGSQDIIGSDAVFEHLRYLPAVLHEFHRVLKPGGVLYATFGPLWYTWGGDHISGYDGILSGYNHLLLDPASYHAYLDRAGVRKHSEHDGRTWAEHGLFSYMRPMEYLAVLKDAGFERQLVGAIIESRAVDCLRQLADVRERLLADNSKLDLIITGMTIVYRKPQVAEI